MLQVNKIKLGWSVVHLTHIRPSILFIGTQVTRADPDQTPVVNLHCLLTKCFIKI